MMGGETLLIKLITRIIGYVSQNKHKKLSSYIFGTIKAHQENTVTCPLSIYQLLKIT